MIIRCERCSTLYDLDEKLLAPEGSQVQCVKCQAVFTAAPPRPASPPAGPAATPMAPARTAAHPPVVTPASAPPPATTARAERPGPRIYRPPQRPAAPAPPARGRGRASAPPRDAVSAMDARLRRLARWRLAAIPVALAVLLLVAWGAWSAWKRRPDPETQRQRAEAMALITQDDAASLARAVALLDAILGGDHPSTASAGERGLARALLATALAEEAEPLGERLASGIAEKARLERERPPGYEDGQRALAMEVTRLEAELAPRRQKLREVEARAAEDLQAVAASSRGGAEAARGQAVLAVLAGDAEEVHRAAALLRGAGPDSWADLVELWLAVRRDGAARDQAIPRLVALTGARPEMIRARFVLARALLSAGRREESISAVAGLLAANPRHERAQRLRAQLTASSPPQPPEPPPPAPRPAWTPRPVASPAPAVAGNALGTVPVPSPAPPPQAAGNQAVIPATPPPGPTVEVPVPEAPSAPPPAPPPVPAPKAKPPDPGRVFDPTDG